MPCMQMAGEGHLGRSTEDGKTKDGSTNSAGAGGAEEASGPTGGKPKPYSRRENEGDAPEVTTQGAKTHLRRGL